MADVILEADVQRVAIETIARFGGFDTWVNNAGIGIYAAVADLELADNRKLFETNYWGVVHGSVVALRHFKERCGGAIINVGSINGDMGSPLLASYNASKHAVKGFTDSLRIEMIEADLPIWVTLIKPSAIGTPFPQHGRNLTEFSVRLPRPIYKPQLVADAILDAAQRPRRAVTVGGAGKLQVLGATLFPALFDRIASSMTHSLIDRDRPVEPLQGNLYAPRGGEARVEGDQIGRGVSIFTRVSRYRRSTRALIGATVVGALALGVRKGSR